MHIYFHVPFCARRCSYCDFAIAVRREIPSDGYADAVLREWATWESDPVWAESPCIETIYFGGGTPSRIDPGAIARIIDRIARDRPITGDAEITIEANPDDVTPPRAAAWHGAGVNRVSLGVQSFDPAVLSWMHRTHTAEQASAAVDVLRDVGTSNLSLDLIFGLPPQLARDWEADLARALALHPEHVSLYGLTVEHHTPLARWAARGELTPVDEDRYAGEFLTADAALRANGYQHYEVSNAARPGYRARHNSAYWSRAPFIGLGPSAHSGLGKERRWNLREWAAYERAIRGGETVVAGREQVDPSARRLEELYLGLRTWSGVATEQVPAEDRRRWVEAGWATATDGRVRLTPEGWLRLDALVASVRG